MENKIEKLLEAAAPAAAKAGRQSIGYYLPLGMHSIDTGEIMGKLFDRRISRHEKEVLIKDMQKHNPHLKDLDERCLRKIFVLLGYLHDLGKMTAVFQSKILKKLPNYDLFPDGRLAAAYERFDRSYHTLMGADYLVEMGFPPGLASVVASHHGSIPVELVNYLEEYEDGVTELDESPNVCKARFGTVKDGSNRSWWNEKVRSILEAAADLSGISSIQDIPEFSKPCLMLLAGYLIEADWIASNEKYFPLISVSEREAPKFYPERVEAGWERLAFPDVWSCSADSVSSASFQRMFGFSPRRMQNELIDILNQIQNPGLLIIEAQMGEGKTEAALLAADYFAGKSGCGGIFYGLPTQATANGMFPRFKRWSQDEAAGSVQSLKLAHGMAQFQEQYAEIPRGTVQVDEIENPESSLVVHDWMEGRKVGLFSDFVIGTVDQLLMGGLNAWHVMLRHAGLAGKVVIIDEVHAYDIYMNAYLDCMLRWLGAYHTPVILLSATLPKERKKELAESYLKGYRNVTDENADLVTSNVLSAVYPAVTWTDGEQIHTKHIVPERQQTVVLHKETVDSKQDETDRIKQYLKSQHAASGCTGIIVNTIQKAEELGRELSASFPSCQIIVVHSRFTVQRRAELEKKIEQLTGKDSREEERKGVIVIGTQVLEQSLDLDFDCLITELAPVDLLIQRIGRVWRHKRTWRDQMVSSPEVCVITGMPEKIRNVKQPYDPWLLIQTDSVLPQTLSIPDSVSELTESVYASPVDPIPEKELWNDKMLEQKKKSQLGKDHCLGNPSTSEFEMKMNYMGLCGLMPKDKVRTEEEAGYSVRLIEKSVRCILMRKESGSSEMFYYGADQNLQWKYDPSQELNQTAVHDVLSQQISVPVHRFGLDLEAELLKVQESGLEEWKENSLLRDCIFLILDHEGKLETENCILHYSGEFGLEISLKR